MKLGLSSKLSMRLGKRKFVGNDPEQRFGPWKTMIYMLSRFDEPEWKLQSVTI